MVQPIQHKRREIGPKGTHPPVSKKVVARSSDGPAEMIKKINAAHRQQRRDWITINRNHPLFRDWMLGQIMSLCRDEQIDCRIESYRMGDSNFQGIRVMLTSSKCDSGDDSEGCVESLFDGYYEHRWLPLGVGYQVITASLGKAKKGSETVVIPTLSQGVSKTLKGIKRVLVKKAPKGNEVDISQALRQMDIKRMEGIARWSEFAANMPTERDFIIGQTIHMCRDNDIECKPNSDTDLFGEPFYSLDVSFSDEEVTLNDDAEMALEAFFDEMSEEKRIPFNFQYQIINTHVNPETHRIEGSIMPVPPEDFQLLFSTND